MVAEGMEEHVASTGRLVSAAGGRAEVDTRAPFRSVKEAVQLFGERVLAGEVYAPRITQMRGAANKCDTSSSRIPSLIAELEAAKHDLEKAREEALTMVNCLASLKEELEETKTELRRLKARDRSGSNNSMTMYAAEVVEEDVKFVETAVEIVASNQSGLTLHGGGGESEVLSRRQRLVTFADPPSSGRDPVLVVPTPPEGTPLRERCTGLGEETVKKTKKKVKKKPLIPSMVALFPKKKGSQQQPKANENGGWYY